MGWPVVAMLLAGCGAGDPPAPPPPERPAGCDVREALAARAALPAAEWSSRWSEVEEPRSRTATQLDAVVPWPEGGIAGVVSCRDLPETDPTEQVAFLASDDGAVRWMRPLGSVDRDDRIVWERPTVQVRPADALPALLIVEGDYRRAGLVETVDAGRAALWLAPAVAKAEALGCERYHPWMASSDGVFALLRGQRWDGNTHSATVAIRSEITAHGDEIVVSEDPGPNGTRWERHVRWKGARFAPDCAATWSSR